MYLLQFVVNRVELNETLADNLIRNECLCALPHLMWLLSRNKPRVGSSKKDDPVSVACFGQIQHVFFFLFI